VGIIEIVIQQKKKKRALKTPKRKKGEMWVGWGQG